MKKRKQKQGHKYTKLSWQIAADLIALDAMTTLMKMTVLSRMLDRKADCL